MPPLFTKFALTIAALGDSVTLGTRADKSVLSGQTFAALLQAALNEPVVNAGIGGNTSSQMLERLQRDVLDRKPRAVLLMAGLNDAAYVDPGPVARATPRVPLDLYESNLREIIARVRATGAVAVVLTPNPMTKAYRYHDFPFYKENGINAAVAQYAEAARRAARATNSCLVDIYATWTADADHARLLPDGIHPNPEGHARIAAQVRQACGEVLAPKAP